MTLCWTEAKQRTACVAPPPKCLRAQLRLQELGRKLQSQLLGRWSVRCLPVEGTLGKQEENVRNTQDLLCG